MVIFEGNLNQMKRETIEINEHLRTICWNDGKLVDWALAGITFSINGKEGQLGKYQYGFSDSVTTSADGIYALIYDKLGTKGLLLKNGDLLREVNRSYYCASVYEYPAAFAVVDNITYLIHCPFEYCRLEFENVETGEIVTNIKSREPKDRFHSRLELSPCGTFLMSKGWWWHPLDIVEIFNIKECLANPLLLDEAKIYPDGSVEVCTANFIDKTRVLLGTSDEVLDDENMPVPVEHIAIWDIVSNELSGQVKVQAEFGNLFVINENFAWDLYKYPKIINIKTGEITEQDETISSGEQKSSIIGNSGKLPKIAFNNQTKQMAILVDKTIHILTPSDKIKQPAN
jgi:hypothetical protein